ncbi:MAG: TonB-dependent receptor [Sphingomonas sp.]
MRNHLLIGAAVAALMIPAAASAQETTSTIRGTVTANGAPVSDAKVVITDVNSGTVSTATTDSAGAFITTGLRVGGPYTVEVTSLEGNQTVTDIYTVLQAPYDLPIDLATGSAAASNDIIVTASSIRGAGTASTGLRTVLTQDDIQKVASVNRDIRDIERRDPLASMDLSNTRAVSFGGVNPRYNRFTINGVQVGDNFGLNSDANPTGRGPIPFDAIAQVSTSAVPWDIRQGNFQGGAIDTVLASGTNEFRGTTFYSLSTNDLQGKRIGSTTVTVPAYKSKTYGATLSGPIFKDTLFFMVSAERNTDPRPLATTSVSSIPGLTQAQVDNVTSIAKSVYGYDTGGFVTVNNQKDEKIVGRIDWNITGGQRLSLSYINAYESSTVAQGTSTSATSPAIGLASDYYQRSVLLRAGIAQLNSDWTDRLSTEARFIYKYNKVGQDPLQGTGFAQFTVCTAPTSVNSGTNLVSSCGTGIPTVVFGPDISRQTNQLFFDTWGGSFLIRYTAGAHQFKMLAEVSANRTFNYFLQRSAGTYYFDSIADFQNRTASTFGYANAVSLNTPDVAADFKYQQYTFGMQDDWDVTSRLHVEIGGRFDIYAQRSPVALNTSFLARNGFSNTKTYKGLSIFQPRFSATWKATDDLRVRGGIGVFGGGSPDIYLSNSYSNTGVLSNSISTVTRATPVGGNALTCTAPYAPTTGTPPVVNPNAGVCTAALNGVTGKSIPTVVNTYLSTATASLATAPVNALSRDFRLPSVWKATLSADYKIFGINLGADYLYTKTINAVTFTDLRTVQIGVLPDGRPRYTFRPTPGVTPAQTADTNQDILATNTSRGRSQIFVLRATKEFDWGLSLGGSYTRQDVKDVSAASSSTASSNYFNNPMYDPNNAGYGIGADQVTWAFKYSVGFDHAFFGDYKTRIQLFGETRAGRRFSYTMQSTSSRSTVFGTLGASNLGTNSDQRYLLYVPTGTTDPLVSYGDATTAGLLDSIINSTVLSKYRGKIAPKNIARNRAFTRIDLHLEQQIPTFVGGSRITLFGDIENLPNLLNKNWGGLRQLAFPQYAPLVQVTCLQTAGGTPTTGTTGAGSACAQYSYSAYRAPNTGAVSSSNSLYLIRVGARFSF